MSRQSIALEDLGKRAPMLGFGCASMMGRVGRKASLVALAAAYNAGVIFYDTARSYGYGESEALLGDFLHGRRDQVFVSTKFGIVPTARRAWTDALKPVARAVLQVAPGVRKAMQRQLGAMSSSGHFSVAALHASLDASLRALRTDYVDFLFLHEPPASVLQQEDLFVALRDLVTAGKVRRFGVAAPPEVLDAATAARVPGLQSVQFSCNVFDLRLSRGLPARQPDIVAIVNQPFGGAAGIAKAKTLLASLAAAAETPRALAEKLQPMDDRLLADMVLNVITRDTGVRVVVPSMLQLDHVRTNVAAMQHSRFCAEEIHWLRDAIVASSHSRRD